ncbi:unnamed protein product [Arctogadus glacialis]
MGVVDRGIIPRRRRGLGVGSSISIVNSKNGELGEGNCESDSVDESTGWGWETVNGVDSQGCGEGNSESDSTKYQMLDLRHLLWMNNSVTTSHARKRLQDYKGSVMTSGRKTVS